jgi:hypothetical protein
LADSERDAGSGRRTEKQNGGFSREKQNGGSTAKLFFPREKKMNL